MIYNVSYFEPNTGDPKNRWFGNKRDANEWCKRNEKTGDIESSQVFMFPTPRTKKALLVWLNIACDGG